MLEQKDLEMIARIVTDAVAPLRQDIAVLQKEVADLRNDMTALQKEVADLQRKVADLQERVTVLERGMTELSFIVETDINKQIAVVAEGHLDLGRKLDQALKDRTEREGQELRIIKLERDVRQLKKKVEAMA